MGNIESEDIYHNLVNVNIETRICRLVSPNNRSEISCKGLKGGALAEKNSIEKMIFLATQNAKCHGINVRHGNPNNADGNCIFESVVDNINSRLCFEES